MLSLAAVNEAFTVYGNEDPPPPDGRQSSARPLQ